MRKMLLFVVLVALLSGHSWACSTLGVYRSGRLHYDPEGPYVPFEMGLYIVHWDMYVTAVEYQLTTPDDPAHALFLVLEVGYPPSKSLHLGDPFSGHSITFWPPLTGFPEGYDLLATYTCVTTVACDQMWDYRLKPGPHPDSGELRGTFYPDNELFRIAGLTTTLCLKETPVGGTSWGALKALSR